VRLVIFEYRDISYDTKIGLRQSLICRVEAFIIPSRVYLSIG
jgi:hypothetical protein